MECLILTVVVFVILIYGIVSLVRHMISGKKMTSSNDHQSLNTPAPVNQTRIFNQEKRSYATVKEVHTNVVNPDKQVNAYASPKVTNNSEQEQQVMIQPQRLPEINQPIERQIIVSQNDCETVVQAQEQKQIVNGAYRIPNVNSFKQPSMEWKGIGSSLYVNGYHLKDAMIYYSESINNNDEVSCIENGLLVSYPAEETSESLDYLDSLDACESFEELSPNQRANYLKWLSEGKKDPAINIKYVFMYFHGLERRSLVEKLDQEIIIDELLRLLSIYQKSHSFVGKATSLIVHFLLQEEITEIPDERFYYIIREINCYWPVIVRISKNGETLSPDFAFKYTKNDVRSSRSVVVERVSKQFETLFRKKYVDLYGNGLKFSLKRRCSNKYYPSNPSLDSCNFSVAKLPSRFEAEKQTEPLIQIWSQCVEELGALSRKIQQGKDINSKEAYMALPDSLKKEMDHPDKDKWEKLASGDMDKEGFALVQISILAQLMGFEEKNKLTAKQSEELAITANEVGFNIVPDTRIISKAYLWNDNVVLYRPDTEPSEVTDPNYIAASIILELGILIAAADGEIEDVEILNISSFIEEQFQLSLSDVRRLEAYKRVLIKQQPSMKSIVKKLKPVLNAEQLEMAAKFMVGVAAVNKIIDKNELSVIRSIYKAFDIEPAKLENLLSQLVANEPIVIQRSSKSTKKGEPIPFPEDSHKSNEIVLNDDILRNILAETKEVSQMLGAVIQEAEEEDEQGLEIIEKTELFSPQQEEIPPGRISSLLDKIDESKLEQLDYRYREPLSELLEKGKLSKEEFEILARKHSLMPSGMLDTINTWADENLGDFLILEGDLHEINNDILR